MIESCLISVKTKLAFFLSNLFFMRQTLVKPSDFFPLRQKASFSFGKIG